MAKYEGIEKFIFADTYNLFLKYKDMPNQDAYWEQCVNEAKMICLKYQNHPLARILTSATVDQITHVVNKTTLLNRTREQWEFLLTNSHKMGL